MRGAPQSAFARLIAPMSVRSSAETFGLQTRLRDRQRQYARNPARCQRMTVSGRTIATTARRDRNQRQSQTNTKRSVLSRCGRFGVRRRSTLTCCRKTRFSASSVALALKREARIPRISLNRSVIRMRAYAVRLLRLRRIEFSVHTGALCIAVANNRGAPLFEPARHRILIETGTEVLAGSTRMEAGTAQKVVLNLFFYSCNGLAGPRLSWSHGKHARKQCEASAPSRNHR